MEVWQISHVSITYHKWPVKICVPRGLADAAKCTNPRPHWRVGSLVPSKLTELTVSCLTCGHYWKVVSIFFIFTPIWGRFPFWLIFFKGVETTKKIILAPFLVLKIVVYSRPLLILFPSVPIKVNWKHRGSSKSMAQLIFTWTKGCTWTNAEIHGEFHILTSMSSGRSASSRHRVSKLRWEKRHWAIFIHCRLGFFPPFRFSSVVKVIEVLFGCCSVVVWIERRSLGVFSRMCGALEGCCGTTQIEQTVSA